uniref:CSON000396 protein n=1 Tax=Culicoides sonorensis TaxID=179676 RepID=A0A336MK52_CULSO
MSRNGKFFFLFLNCMGKYGTKIGCTHDTSCPLENACINGICKNPCSVQNPCQPDQECQVHNHEMACVKVCQCQRSSECPPGTKCNGCNCIQKDEYIPGCENCPPGIACNPLTHTCAAALKPSTTVGPDDTTTTSQIIISNATKGPRIETSTTPSVSTTETVTSTTEFECESDYGDCITSTEKSVDMITISENADKTTEIKMSTTEFVTRPSEEVTSESPTTLGTEVTLSSYMPSIDVTTEIGVMMTTKKVDDITEEPINEISTVPSTVIRTESVTSSDEVTKSPTVETSTEKVTSEFTTLKQDESTPVDVMSTTPYGDESSTEVTSTTSPEEKPTSSETTTMKDQITSTFNPQEIETSTKLDSSTQKFQDKTTTEFDCDSISGDCITSTVEPDFSSTFIPQTEKTETETTTIGNGEFLTSTQLTIDDMTEITSIKDESTTNEMSTKSYSDEVSTIPKTEHQTVTNEIHDETTTVSSIKTTGVSQDETTTMKNEFETTTIQMEKDSSTISVTEQNMIESSTKKDDETTLSFTDQPESTVSDMNFKSTSMSPEMTTQVSSESVTDEIPQDKWTTETEPEMIWTTQRSFEMQCNDSVNCMSNEMCINERCVKICDETNKNINNKDCIAISDIIKVNQTTTKPSKPSGGTPRLPTPCISDKDCIETEACYMGLCQDPCEFRDVCAVTAQCLAKMHRPICSCPSGHEGNPMINCTAIKNETIKCTTNQDCGLTEACIANICQRPCDLRNPCVPNAVCLNVNHGSDCSCIEGYQGNGYVKCETVQDRGPAVCQYNEDCPPEKLCDRLNRRCINPCMEDSCGLNAECYPANHVAQCRCLPGYTGNAYVECQTSIGCRSDSECSQYEACINGQCGSPCECGINSHCDVVNHRAICKCPPGYQGDARIACDPPSNPCDPNPCGEQALCEIDRGNPICFCPKGLTGNPFVRCIPDGGECSLNACGPNSGCRIVNGSPLCFCLPEFEGQPPQIPCHIPEHPCNPSVCGPNTQCSILPNGYAKCTCLAGYVESPNTIRGCVEPRDACDPNPCGTGAICDSNRNPVCYCPESFVGNPFKLCQRPIVIPELCAPGPCGLNADCYVVNNQEQCYCKPGLIGDAYSECREPTRTACDPNPCGPRANCIVLPNGSTVCQCPDGYGGDPSSPTGCHGYEFS